MGKKSAKAPEYQSASYNTGGLFGSSTTNKSGTTYKPSGWISNTMGTVGNNWNSTLNSMLNNDFTKDANFQAYQNQFNKQMNDYYDTNVLSNLANRGLMRSSGLQAATNAFADTLAQNQLNLYDNYYNRMANNLSALMNTSNSLYNYITGVNQGSQNQANALNQYNLNKTSVNNSGSGNTFGNIANAIGSAASIAGGIASDNPLLAINGANGLANSASGLSGGNGSTLYNSILGATQTSLPTTL